MMNLDPWIEAQLGSDRPDVFWSIEVPHATGTLYLADRSVYAGGNLFQGGLLAVDDVQSLADPDEKTADVPSMTVVVDGAPRILPSNYRFAHYINIDPFFQSRLIDAYLNVVGTLGNKRVRMFVGVPRRPISRGYDNTTFRLASAMEHYLGKALCRTVKRDAVHYPSLRLADVGRAVPFVIGGSPSSPIRNVRAIMRRPRQASLPVPDPSNTGDATLGRPTITETAVNETWTVTARGVQQTSHLDVEENDYQLLASDPDPSYGDGVRRIIWRSFVPTVTDRITGIKLRLERLSTDTGVTSVMVVLYTDDGGTAPFGNNPDTWIAYGGLSPNAIAGVADVEVPIGRSTLSGDTMLVAGTKYWIGIRTIGAGVVGGRFKLHFESPSTFNGEVNGSGTRVARYTSAYDNPPATGDTSVYTDFTAIVGTPIFEIQWEHGNGPNYEVTGTASGDQGISGYDEDFVTPSGRLIMPSDIWSGEPDGGDVWTFTTSVLPAQLVFCETGPTTVAFSVTEPGMPGFTWVDIAHADLDPRFADDTPIGTYTPYPFAHDGIGYVGMIETMKEVTEEDEVYADLRIATFGDASVDESSPMDQATNILRRAGVPAAFIDFAHYTTTKAALAALSWTTGGMVNEPGRDAKSVLLDLAFQSRCRFEWIRDKARFRFIADPPDEPDLVIARAKVRMRAGTKVPNIKIDQIDSPRIVNVVTARYLRDWSQSAGAAAYLEATPTLRDEISIGDGTTGFGERSDDAFFLCDFITDDDVAAMFAAFWLSQLAYPKDVGFAELTLDMVKLEPGDVIAFELPES